MGARRRRRRQRRAAAARSKNQRVTVATSGKKQSAVTKVVNRLRDRGKGGMWGRVVRGGPARPGGISRKPWQQPKLKDNEVRVKGKRVQMSKNIKQKQRTITDNKKQHGESLAGNSAKNYQSKKLIKG
jgi:hypothetical protein